MNVENLKDLKETIESAIEIINSNGSYVDSITLTGRDQDLYSFDKLPVQLKNACLNELSTVMSEQIKKYNWINNELVSKYGLSIEMIIRMHDDETDEKNFVDFINEAIDVDDPIYITVSSDYDNRHEHKIRITSNFQEHLKNFFEDYRLFRESPNLIAALKWLSTIDLDKVLQDREPGPAPDFSHLPVDETEDAEKASAEEPIDPSTMNPMAMMANAMMNAVASGNGPFKDVIEDDEESIIDPEKVKAIQEEAEKQTNQQLSEDEVKNIEKAVASGSISIPVDEVKNIELDQAPDDFKLEDERDD